MVWLPMSVLRLLEKANFIICFFVLKEKQAIDKGLMKEIFVSVISFDQFLKSSLMRRRPSDAVGGAVNSEARSRTLSPQEQKKIDQITSELDILLGQMVHKMETAASCRQEDSNSTDQANFGKEPAGMKEQKNTEEQPPFAAFCFGLLHIAEQLIPHLAQKYEELCQELNVPHDVIQWAIKARIEALNAYLMQLAQVHGLAFDGAPSEITLLEKETLAQFEKNLASIAARFF